MQFTARQHGEEPVSKLESMVSTQFVAADVASPTKRPAKVEMRGVEKVYAGKHGRTAALSGLDLTVQDGEFLCLIGDSGCGKSTLLELIAGFESATDGDLLVEGVSVEGPSHRRGMIFQEASLLPWLTVERNISLGLDIRSVPAAARVREVIEVMGLSGFERHRPMQLSGGMAQRVAIARALVNEPDILLLDEPFGALDAFTRKRLQGELVALWQRRRFTAIFVTHDIEEAVFLGTRVALMAPRPGRISAVFNVSLRHPRDRMSPEVFRLSAMITREFMTLDRRGHEPSLANGIS